MSYHGRPRLLVLHGGKSFLKQPLPSRRTPEIAQYLSLLAPMKYWNACENQTTSLRSAVLARSHRSHGISVINEPLSRLQCPPLEVDHFPLLLLRSCSTSCWVPLLQRELGRLALFACESAAPDITLPSHLHQWTAPPGLQDCVLFPLAFHLGDDLELV